MLVVGWSYGYNFTVTAPAAQHRCASRTRDRWVEGETRRWLVRWETQEILIQVHRDGTLTLEIGDSMLLGLSPIGSRELLHSVWRTFAHERR